MALEEIHKNCFLQGINHSQMQTWTVSRHSASHSSTTSREMAMIGFGTFIKTIWNWNLIFRCTNIWPSSQEYTLQSIIAVLKAAVPILDHSQAWKMPILWRRTLLFNSVCSTC